MTGPINEVEQNYNIYLRNVVEQEQQYDKVDGFVTWLYALHSSYKRIKHDINSEMDHCCALCSNARC